MNLLNILGVPMGLIALLAQPANAVVTITFEDLDGGSTMRMSMNGTLNLGTGTNLGLLVPQSDFTSALSSGSASFIVDGFNYATSAGTVNDIAPLSILASIATNSSRVGGGFFNKAIYYNTPLVSGNNTSGWMLTFNGSQQYADFAHDLSSDATRTALMNAVTPTVAWTHDVTGDSFQYAAALVPEPSTTLLLVFSGVCSLLYRKRPIL